MPIDDPIEHYEKNIEEELGIEPGAEGALAVVRAFSSTIPGVIATPILAIFDGLGQRRVNQRFYEMMRYFGERIRQIEGKVRPDFFSSSEFQSYLFAALQQVFTTDQQRKLRMLGVGLANSANVRFERETRQDTFFQILRDLNLMDLELLAKMRDGYTIRDAFKRGKSSEALRAQLLEGLGVVEQYLEPIPLDMPQSLSASQNLEDIRKRIEHLMQDPFVRVFGISELGRDFFSFMEPGEES
ncbi:MAG: hypothetical protein ACJ71Q_17280 [Terriglobales bacterium]